MEIENFQDRNRMNFFELSGKIKFTVLLFSILALISQQDQKYYSFGVYSKDENIYCESVLQEQLNPDYSEVIRQLQTRPYYQLTHPAFPDLKYAIRDCPLINPTIRYIKPISQILSILKKSQIWHHSSVDEIPSKPNSARG